MIDHEKFMRRAILLAEKGMNSNAGGPFGAVIVKNGEIVGEAHNKVTSTNDPTAHAEVNAIREACKNLNTFQLEDCDIYTSCEPCPMCLGAIYWARLKNVYYACNRFDAKNIDFDDQFIYEEIDKDIDKREIGFIKLMRDEALKIFQEWQIKINKIEY